MSLAHEVSRLRRALGCECERPHGVKEANRERPHAHAADRCTTESDDSERSPAERQHSDRQPSQSDDSDRHAADRDNADGDASTREEPDLNTLLSQLALIEEPGEAIRPRIAQFCVILLPLMTTSPLAFTWTFLPSMMISPDFFSVIDALPALSVSESSATIATFFALTE